MTSSSRTLLKFSINSWQHLYSLQQAVSHADMLGGNHLHIQGKVRGDSLLDKQDTPVDVHFLQLNVTPNYARDPAGQIILGKMLRAADKLSAEIQLDARVFEELRRNLKEYTAVDGIHIVVTIELLLQNTEWPVNSAADIIALDYAMKGDV